MPTGTVTTGGQSTLREERAPAKGGQGHRIDAGFSSPRHHDISVAAADQVEGVPDRIRSGRACRRRRTVGALEAVADADRTRRRVRQDARHQKRAYSAHAPASIVLSICSKCLGGMSLLQA